MRIRGQKFGKPANARHGYYVLLEGTFREVRSPEALAMAQKAASWAGYDPDGEHLIGVPTSRGGETNTRAFWFYNKMVIPNCVSCDICGAEILLHNIHVIYPQELTVCETCFENHTEDG
jgi:hypothetical protein